MSWDAAFADRRKAAALQPAARGPATLGEVWRSEWDAAGLDTAFGVQKPMNDAYDELFSRTREVTGREIAELARERGLDFLGRSFDGRIDTIGKIIDSLPDPQQKLLADYKDVRGRARAKASETIKEAEEARAASTGLSPMAVGFAAQIARAMADPVNLATAPLGPARLAQGAGKAAVGQWLAKEAATGAGVQALQEPGIRTRREELGLDSNSLENIVTAGIGQAGFALLFRAGGAAMAKALDAARGGPEWRVGVDMQRLAEGVSFDADAMARLARRPQGDMPMTDRGLPSEPLPTAEELAQLRMDRAAPEAAARARLPDISEEDFAALARHEEAAALTDAAVGAGPLQQEAARQAARYLEEGGPIPTGLGGHAMAGLRDVILPDGERFPVRYAVVERRDLLTSHSADGAANPDYPTALQPRDRSRVMSADQVNAIAARLEPELLGFSPSPEFGAPIIGPDRLVESGNGRVLAIEAVYRRGLPGAQAYRAFLERNGFDIDGMDEPVLVRQRVGDMTPQQRVKLALDSNRPPVAEMGAADRALADARLMDDGVMDLWAGGKVDSAANMPFARAFIDRALSANERGRMFTKGGTELSEDGVDRIERALVARAWPDRDIVEALTERTDPDAKGVLKAMAEAAPEAARLRAALADGRIETDADVLAPILDAYRLTARARREGRKVAELIDQPDLERGAITPATETAVRLFHADDAMTQPASPQRMAARLQSAVNQALMHQGGGLFGGLDDPAGMYLRAALHAGDATLSGVDLAKAMGKAAEAQPVKGMTLDDLFALAPEVDARMREAGAAVAAETGATFKAGPIKVRADAEAKMTRKRYADAAALTDIVRGGYIVQTPAMADAVAAALARRYPQVVDEGWTVSPAGYIDRKIIAVDETGVRVEYQLWESAMLDAKDKRGGHDLYKQSRRLAVDDPARIALEDEQRALYGRVADALSADWKASLGNSGTGAKRDLNSSTLTNLADMPTSALSTRSQAPSMTAQASPGVQSAGRPSQTQVFMEPPSRGAQEAIQNTGDLSSEKVAAAAKPDPLAVRMDAVLAEAGGDMVLHMPRADGTLEAVPAREVVARLADERRAVAELQDCIVRAGGGG